MKEAPETERAFWDAEMKVIRQKMSCLSFIKRTWKGSGGVWGWGGAVFQAVVGFCFPIPTIFKKKGKRKVS